MRLVQFTTGGEAAPRPGSMTDNGDILDLQRASSDTAPSVPKSMTALLAQPEWRTTVERLTSEADRDAVVPRDEANIVAPVTDPEKVVCVGLNYLEHVEESGGEPPDNPVLFAKFPSAITGPNSTISWDPDLTSEVDYEAELAIVMGDRARRVDRDSAAECIAGYTAANDVSARDLQFADDQWVRGKTLDTFCPLGPSLVTADELEDPNDLDIWAEVNGERLQESNTGDMVFDVAELVSFCSQAFTLEPGDVILTGTPPGVGAFREPPVYLQDGDEVTVGIEDIGELENSCAHVE